MDEFERKLYRILRTENDEGGAPVELRQALNKEITATDSMAVALTQPQVNALLKKMEKSGFIKSVKG